MENFDDLPPEWEPDIEYHPIFRMLSAQPMDYTDYWTRHAEDRDGELPELW